jgi:nitrate/TMAO reductase-like tetraheme cytochrome c subunit
MFRNGRLLSSLALSMSLFLLAGLLPAGAQESAVAQPTVAAADAAAAAPAIPNEKCLGCHDDAEMKNEAGNSVAVLEAQFAVSAHKRVNCVECHTAALGVKHKGKRQPLGPVSFDVCMECHEEEITPFQGSVHGRVKGGKPASCQGCHGSVHTVVRSNNPNAAMAPLNQVRNCGVCHESMLEGYLSSVHAKSLFVSGLTEAAPSCSDCHGSHDIQRHDAAGARTSHAKSP